MKFFTILFFSFFLVQQNASAQFTRYIIKLKDKGTNPFSLANPSQYLTQRSIARRQRYNIAIDSTDLPVTPRYIDSIRLAGNVEILNSSKWLNQVAIKTSDAAALAKINSFPFVISSAPVAAKNGEGFVTKDKFGTGNTEESILPYNYGLSNGQVKIHRADWLHNRGFRGEGMQMAVLDAGFYHYLTLPTFDSIRLNNQILGTWDFVQNEASVDEDNAHGMQCLSTIAANLPGTFVGTAPKTSFYLYRTEDVFSEYPIEEQNWVAGMERADSLGVDITSTSLGYYQFDNPIFDYTYANMNGNTTISARGADLSAKKGMLNVIANGNEGGSSWRFLITPADADSVLSVGAVDTLGNVAGFSSYGPSSDGQIKPTVAAVGLRAVIANTFNGQPQYGNGTSFACPNMAGVTTCLWQAFPEVNNMSVINALQKSATKANNPDDRVGYGIPDAVKAFIILEKQLYTQTTTLENCAAIIKFTAKTTNDIKVFLERRLQGETVFTKVDSVQGQGAFALRNYTFTNNLSGIAIGSITYRTSMTIGTEPLFYLDSASVNLQQVCDVPVSDQVTAGPNPVQGDLTVNVRQTTAAEIIVELNNALGQKIYKQLNQQSAGIQQYKIPMANLAKGVYYLSVYADGKRIYSNRILK